MTGKLKLHKYYKRASKSARMFASENYVHQEASTSSGVRCSASNDISSHSCFNISENNTEPSTHLEELEDSLYVENFNVTHNSDEHNSTINNVTENFTDQTKSSRFVFLAGTVGFET